MKTFGAESRTKQCILFDNLTRSLQSVARQRYWQQTNISFVEICFGKINRRQASGELTLFLTPRNKISTNEMI